MARRFQLKRDRVRLIISADVEDDFTVVACCDSCQHRSYHRGFFVCVKLGGFNVRRAQPCGWCQDYKPINWVLQRRVEDLG